MGGPSGSRGRLGAVFVLSLVWLLFEFGRPPTPSGIPLVISGVLFVDWLGRKNKQWSRDSVWWFVLLGLIPFGAVFAPNTYSVAMLARKTWILVLGLCFPLQAMMTSVRRVRVWIYSMIAVCWYVGLWAATHGGYGPAGAWGAQDENYVAALMVMAIPMAYFSMFAEKRPAVRLLLVLSIAIFLAAIVRADNPSRGGFIALCAVALYAIARSPRKGLGFGVLALGGVLMMLIAGPTFWKEIGTSTDTKEGTADIRLEIWKAGIRMWASNPVFGVGAGNFIWEIGDYQTAEQMEKFGHSLSGSIVAHSLPVECLAELGSVGAIAVLALVFGAWRELGRIIRWTSQRSRAPAGSELAQLRCYADAMRGAIIGIMVSGVFLSLLWTSHLWVLLAASGALPFLLRRAREPGAEGTRLAPRTGHGVAGTA